MILNLLDRMKLPFRKNKEFLSALYDILGFYPHNLEIYRIAFSHKSLGYHRDNDNRTSAKDRRGNASAKDRRKSRSENTAKPLNNERLEYLGDAVLESVVSDILFRHFPHKREGFLTSTRSKIVQREALNRLAADMGLEKLILAAQGTRMAHTNIGGNAFEALMGAIYLDRGYKHCHWFISNRIVGRYVNLDNVAQKEVNFKSKLLEWSQKNRININFKDSAADDRGFKTIITMEGITLARGNGRSKKESQQEASKEALTRMRREPKTYDSIFRAKEKRTAMEAEESFALPKIDEIESTLAKSRKAGKADKATESAPVLEEKKDKRTLISDAAYDTAYDESATFEVIDTPPVDTPLTADVYEEKGLPAPPEEDELRAADEKLRKKRTRNRGPKTVGDAVKGMKKGETTAEEKAEKRNNERLAEVERQRAKAERKRQQKQAEQEQAKTAEEEAKHVETKPIEAEHVETKDVELQPAEAIPAEAKTVEVEVKNEVGANDQADKAIVPPTEKPIEAMTAAEMDTKAREVAALVCGIMDKARIDNKPQDSIEVASEAEGNQPLPEVEETVKEEISEEENQVKTQKEAEEVAPSTEEFTQKLETDSPQNDESVTTISEESAMLEETNSTVSEESAPKTTSALTFDAIMFSSEHDDNLGLLHEEDTIEPTQESEANEAAEQAPNPSAQRKRKSRRRPHSSAKKAKEGNPQTGESNPKEVNEPSKASDKGSDKDSKKSPNKRSHRRRRPSSGRPNKGEAPTAQPQ